jgi:diguanylate cyclase (GGDEF)-like protein
MNSIVSIKPRQSARAAALPHELMCAARQEQDADMTQILMAMVRLVDRRTPCHLRSCAVTEVLNTVSALAFRDELTGVLNRRGFMRQSFELLRRAARTGQRATLFYADVNNLKQLNDAAGHGAGDELLARTGDVLRVTFRSGDVVGRLGGDEFAALALSPNRRCDQRIRQRLGHALKDANSKPAYPPVSLSVGIAWRCPTLPLSLDELIGQADRAMYAIKQLRRPERVACAVFPDTAAFAI